MVDVRNSRVLTFDVGGSHISAALCLGDNLSLGPVASAQYGDITTSEGFVGLLFELASKAAGGDPSGIGATLAVREPRV